MGPIVCPEMSVKNYRYILRNNPEEQSSLLLSIVCSREFYFFLEIKVQKILF
jgi:hypothetical protein